MKIKWDCALKDEEYCFIFIPRSLSKITSMTDIKENQEGILGVNSKD